MDPGNDLSPADRDPLIGIIVRQQAIIESQEKRTSQMDGQTKSSGSRSMPGLKPKGDRNRNNP